MTWDNPKCPNYGYPLWLEDPANEGYYCRRCGEWFYPNQDMPDDIEAFRNQRAEEMP